MDAERHQRLESWFHQALALPAAERERFVAACRVQDVELAAQLFALLEQHTDTDHTLQPALKTLPIEDPEWIGSYRVERRIGEGGFAVVYLCEQREPVRRRVAIKLLKPGMDSESVLSRFAAERQALAVMDHPSIARIFDAGRDARGYPYFVMEYVEGQPIHRYCEENGLDLRARVELMMGVCEAVHHAHQKGVIHRDLKPSNILVAEVDGKPLPKVIDFGIAKARGLDGLDRHAFTRMGQFLGTPEYCSPEQAAAGERDVDTRTDVYSLGVVLYELLTGQLPFPRERLLEAGLAEIVRVLQEEEPPRPSTRISTLDSNQRRGLQSIGVDARTLARRVRGELDWIVLKTLEKHRARRYESAHGLAEDLGRYLRGDAVAAGPPSASYRMRKFVRRHRTPVFVSALLILSLVAFAATTTIQARRIARERDRASLEAETAEQVARFLTSLFEFSDPGVQRGRDVSARELLDRGAERIDTELDSQPLVQARLLLTMGQVYRRIHEPERAIQFLEKSVHLRAQLLGEHDRETIVARGSLAIVYRQVGRLDEAEAMFRQVQNGLETTVGPDHPGSLRNLANLADLHLETGREEEALALHLRILEARTRVLGPDEKDTLYSRFSVGTCLHALHRNEEAELHLRESLERLRVVRGSDHPNVLALMAELGSVYIDLDRAAEALPLLEEALVGQQKVHGADSPEAEITAGLLERARMSGD